MPTEEHRGEAGRTCQRQLIGPGNGRRAFLLTAGAALVGFAGCTGDDSDSVRPSERRQDDDSDDRSDDPADDEPSPPDPDDDPADPAFPDGSVEVLVGSPAGGRVDTMVRGLQPALEDALGVGTTMTNIAGEEGTEALTELQQRSADGHTIAAVNLGSLARMEFDAGTVAPIASPAANHAAVITDPFRFSHFTDFVAWLTSGDDVRLGITAETGVESVLGHLLLDALGVPLDRVRVRNRDSQQALVEGVAAGDIDLAVPFEAVAEPAVDADIVDLAWIARPDTSARFPDTPTAPEVADTLGLSWLPDVGIELGLFAPSETPDDVLTELGEAALTMVEDPDVVAAAEDDGYSVRRLDATGLSDRHAAFVSAKETFEALDLAEPGTDFPATEIRAIVPAGAGGGMDTAMRILAEVWPDYLGAEIVPDNVTGGQGVVGSEELWAAEADGHTVGILDPLSLVIDDIAANIALDPVGFSWIGRLDRMHVGYVVAADSEYQSFMDLMDAGTVRFSAPDELSSYAVNPAITGTEWGWDTELIRYQNIVEAAYGLSRGEVDVMCGPELLFADLVDDLSLWPILSFQHGGPDYAPETETIWDYGLGHLAPIGGIDRVIAAPPGVPPDPLTHLRESFAQTIVDPDLRAHLAEFGSDASYLEPDEMAEVITELGDLIAANKEVIL